MLYSTYYSNTTGSQTLPLSLIFFAANYRQEPVSRPNGNDFHSWYYVTEGQGELFINNQRSVVVKGQGFYIPDGISHRYAPLTANWELHAFGVNGPIAGEMIQSLSISRPGVYNITDNSIFTNHIKELHQIFRSDFSDKNIRYSKACFGFLLDLSRNIRHITLGIPSTDNPKIQTIIAYLEEHYSEDISLDDLADQVQLTKEYMCSLFKKEMKQTIIAFLTSMRIARARLFLCQYPNRRIQDIAQMCGFDSASYFGMVFKKTMNMTPEEFRNRN